MVNLIIRSKTTRVAKRINISWQVEAASAPDPTIGFLLVMPSGGRDHPNAPLAPYFSLELNSSHSTLHGG